MILLLLMIFQAMHTNKHTLHTIHDPLASYSVNVIHYFDDGIKGWDV